MRGIDHGSHGPSSIFRLCGSSLATEIKAQSDNFFEPWLFLWLCSGFEVSFLYVLVCVCVFG